ncbi:MAG: hypothetical protein PHC46_00030 [Clostridia bacterium]|nr:hypothetical protein [Clostridia bacterium]
MSKKLSKYSNSLQNRVKRTSINHNLRGHLHKMSQDELELAYSKYFAEQGNLDCCIELNEEFQQIDKEDLERYEKWLMESDER